MGTTPVRCLKALLPKNAKLKEGQLILNHSLVYWIMLSVLWMIWLLCQKKVQMSTKSYSNTRRDLGIGWIRFPDIKKSSRLYERKKVREGFEKVFDQKK